MGGAVCFTIIGKDNSRLFVQMPYRDQRNTYDVELFTHCSLDIVDEKAGKSSEMFLSRLFSDNKYESYGYITNTGVKFVLVLEMAHNNFKDQDIRQIFNRFHMAYCKAISNPFHIIGKPIDSRYLTEAANVLFAM